MTDVNIIFSKEVPSTFYSIYYESRKSGTVLKAFTVANQEDAKSFCENHPFSVDSDGCKWETFYLKEVKVG